LIGIQRYSIEQWRDLSGRGLFYVFGVGLRQSELISIALFLLGSAAAVILYRHYNRQSSVPPVNDVNV